VAAPVGPMAPASVQARVATIMAACAAGGCRYRDPTRTRQQCEADWRAGCDGYEGHVFLEATGPVLRWRRCPRYLVWARAERGRLERRHAAETRAKRGREGPRDWSEGGA
jgi:hypothetical protein